MTTIFDFVKSIDSCYSSRKSLQPKVTYENEHGFHYGVFYHEKLDRFIHVDEGNRMMEAEPVLVVYPTGEGKNKKYNKNIFEMYDNYDFVGTADDLSCMIFFRMVRK